MEQEENLLDKCKRLQNSLRNTEVAILECRDSSFRENLDELFEDFRTALHEILNEQKK